MPAVRSAKGTGSVHQLADGRWRAVVDLGIIGGRRRRVTRTRRTQAEARKALREMRAAAEQGLSTNRATLGDWLTYWLDTIAAERVKPQTLDGYRSKVRLYLADSLGYVRLDKLTAEHLEAVYRDMRRQGLSEATIHQTHAIIRRALKVAEQRGRVRRNVAADVELRQAPENPHGVHSPAEVLKILNSAQSVREAARLHVALSCGLRQGEALGLDWKDVHEDAEPAHLRVVQSLQHVRGVGPVLGAPKTKKSLRTVLLTPAAAAMMAAWRAESGGQGLVFTSPTGAPMDPKRDWKDWCEAEQRAGVGHVPLHGARGSVVSTLFDAGVPLEVAAQVMGHTHESTTRRHYLHIADDHAVAAMLALARAQEG